MDDMSSYSPSQEGQNPEPKAAEKKGGHVLTAPELSAFSGQLSLVLKAGITAYEGVTIMRDDAEEGEDKKIARIIFEHSRSEYRIVKKDIYEEYKENGGEEEWN